MEATFIFFRQLYNKLLYKPFLLSSLLEMKKNLNYNIVHLFCILVVCLFTFFINNQIIPADIMESRNLVTAQEMVREGNYLTPTMNGELRLEKPPLPTWIAAGIEIIFPDNLSMQRALAGTMAAMMVVFLYLFTASLTRKPNMALAASLILATSFNVILMGRTATWDIFCHSFMLGAIYFLFIAFEQPGPQWKNLLSAGVFWGLSFLSKGPVAFYALLLPFLISYFLVYKPSFKDKKYAIACMLALGIIISCWWIVYIWIFHPDMALNVAHKESSAWLDRNVRPFYYYWKFPAELGIWTLFFVSAIAHYFIYKKDIFRKEYRFTLIWLFSMLLLLSIIPEKKTRYLLPISIPGALIISFYIYYSVKAMSSKGEKILFKINSLLIAVIFATIPIALYILFHNTDVVSMPLLSIITLFSWALSTWLFLSIFNRKSIQVRPIFSAIILGMMLTTGLCLLPIKHLFINEKRHSIKLIRENPKVEHLPFYYDASEEMRMEIVYETNQTIRPLDLKDTAAIKSCAPFVLVTSHSIDSLFNGKNMAIEFIDTFDNNWRKTTDKKHNKKLVKEVAIIRNIK